MKTRLTLVAGPFEVEANIRRYQAAVARPGKLKDRAGRVRGWYALFDAKSGWLFGPSKFVGYSDNTASRYLDSAKEFASGGETEKHLGQWYEPVDPTSKLGEELFKALAAFCATLGKRPSKAARICVERPVLARSPGHAREAALARISSRPDICGGRPCIRDTRVRVSDVLDMLAAGASAADILADYDYLTREDISAALAYASLAADHIVVKAE